MKLIAIHRRGPSVLRWAIAGVALVVGIGCETQRPANSTPARDTSPQAKYDRVLVELRRMLSPDGSSSGGRYILQNDAGSGTTVTNYEVVAPEVISIPADGTPPQATIDITQVSSYSFLPAARKGGDEADAETTDDEASRDALGEMNANLKEMGVEVLDPNKLQQDLRRATAGRVAPPESTTRSVKTEKRVTYELIYENERWRLARPPAADALEATNIVIQQALQRQL